MGGHLALVEDHKVVAFRDRSRSVRHDDDGLVIRLHVPHDGVQGFRAIGIERRVRLVENKKDGVAVKRAGQREPLFLASGELRVMGANPGVVAVRELLNDVVDAGLLRCLNTTGRVRLSVHLCDILGDRAVEENDVLGQVTDVTTQLVRAVVIKLCPIEAHFPGNGSDQTDNDPREGQFPLPAGLDYDDWPPNTLRKGDVIEVGGTRFMFTNDVQSVGSNPLQFYELNRDTNELGELLVTREGQGIDWKASF